MLAPIQYQRKPLLYSYGETVTEGHNKEADCDYFWEEGHTKEADCDYLGKKDTLKRQTVTTLVRRTH